MDLTTKVNGRLIFEWITRNLPPLTWSIMAVKIGGHFLDHGINPFNLDENEEFEEPLLWAIDHFLIINYGISLPDFDS
jgi:hypothetical protein